MGSSAPRTLDLDRVMMATAWLTGPVLFGLWLALYFAGIDALRSMAYPVVIASIWIADLVLVPIIVRRRRREADEAGTLRP